MFENIKIELDIDDFKDDEEIANDNSNDLKKSFSQYAFRPYPNIDSETFRRCDNCGRLVRRFIARYQNETYCPACYQTWFKRYPCVQCGNLARFHRKLDKELRVCTQCKNTLPCEICGKVNFCFNSKKHGRICNPCYRQHYAPFKKCDCCGQVSRRVWKRNQSDMALCPKCDSQQKKEKTCPKCHHQRTLITTPQGNMCQKCFETPLHQCPKCHDQQIYGGQSHCDNCYWAERLPQTIDNKLAVLRSGNVQNDFVAFMNWLGQQKQFKAAVMKADQFIMFFRHCERVFGCVPRDYSELVSEFKPNGLRTYLTVLRWLQDTGIIQVDKQIKSDIAEQEYIQKMLDNFGGNVPPIIQSFHDFLTEKLNRQKTTLKSFRLAFSAAARVYLSQDLKPDSTLTQAHIDTFIKNHKGQFAALSGFVGFLRTNYGCQLEYTRQRYAAEPTKLDIRRERQALQRQIVALAIKLKEKQPKQPTQAERLRWIVLNMAFHHGIKISLNTAKTITFLPTQDDEIVLAIFKKQTYPIPKFS